MLLSQLASKPQLIKVSIDDQETIEAYNEPLDFYIYDRQPMEKFVRLATLDYTNFGDMATVMREMILDEQGNPVIQDDKTLPSDLLMKSITKVIETLGKSQAKATKSETQNSK